LVAVRGRWVGLSDFSSRVPQHQRLACLRLTIRSPCPGAFYCDVTTVIEVRYGRFPWSMPRGPICVCCNPELVHIRNNCPRLWMLTASISVTGNNCCRAWLICQHAWPRLRAGQGPPAGFFTQHKLDFGAATCSRLVFRDSGGIQAHANTSCICQCGAGLQRHILVRAIPLCRPARAIAEPRPAYGYAATH